MSESIRRTYLQGAFFVKNLSKLHAIPRVCEMEEVYISPQAMVNIASFLICKQTFWVIYGAEQISRLLLCWNACTLPERISLLA